MYLKTYSLCPPYKHITRQLSILLLLFFLNATAPTEIYTLSLHDALPVAKPELSQARFGLLRPGPQRRERVLRDLLGRKHLLEMRGHAAAVRIERGAERVPGVETHCPRDERTVSRLLGQLVRLRIVQVLQPVLQAPQEHVGPGELVERRGGEQLLLREQREHCERRADLQRRVAAAARELEHLRDELDLADAARPELDLIGELPARHLLADLRVQLAHRRE